jgi:hypothetical protein
MLPDPQLKQERGYVDPKTKVFADGREILKGKDWKKRKLEIWNRGQGRCEKIIEIGRERLPDRTTRKDYYRCANEMHDPRHKVTRSKLRDDRAENLIGLCRFHHDLEDYRKVRWSKRVGD